MIYMCSDAYNGADKASFTVQIFWKGDPGVENFVIRFPDEKTMKDWQEKVQKQKKSLSDSSRRSGQNGPSSTTFRWQDDQPQPENPYREVDEDEDDQSSQATLVGSRSGFSNSRNASNNSLRSMGTQLNNPRTVPQRYPGSEQVAGHHVLPSLNTNVPLNAPSPGDHAAHSYFSPSVDSPNSIRSSSQASMYGFPRQTAPHPGWSYENGKHRTAPAMPRAPSREGPPPSTRPSLPVMATSTSGGYPQSQLAQAQNRLRSASTPDINGPGSRRHPNGQHQSPQEPVPPLPNNIRGPYDRSQTTSPHEAQLPIRGTAQSPALQQPTYDNHGQRLLRRHENEPQGHSMAEVLVKPTQADQVTSNPSVFSERDGFYPTQLKVKIHFDPPDSHITIVVPISIKYRTLVDRIDSKMARVSNASIARGTARLRYKDSDGDYVAIKTDEDVGLAIEEWGSIHEQKLRQGMIDDFDLFWQEKA